MGDSYNCFSSEVGLRIILDQITVSRFTIEISFFGWRPGLIWTRTAIPDRNTQILSAWYQLSPGSTSPRGYVILAIYRWRKSVCFLDMEWYCCFVNLHAVVEHWEHWEVSVKSFCFLVSLCERSGENLQWKIKVCIKFSQVKSRFDQFILSWVRNLGTPAPR